MNMAIKDKIVVGITQGDTNGIGYEVIIKALADARILENCVIILYGSSRFFGIYRKFLPEVEQIATNVINSAADARSKRVNIINAVPESMAMEIGQPTPDGAKAAILALQAAVADAKSGAIDALVTAPFNKHTVAGLDFGFPGHTEYLQNRFGQEEHTMFMVSDRLRVGIATGHIPLAHVASSLTTEGILKKLRLMQASLRRDFGIDQPKIAVLGLNPHCGDGGLIGDEEQEIILPAVKAANDEGILAFGPYSPDGFFAPGGYTRFDATLAMYHDQGLAPFKALAFHTGVNFTAGLPIVRTSPDHGTAFEIAGRDEADPQSMMSAIYTAVDIFRRRQAYDDLQEGRMIVKPSEERRSNRPQIA